MSVFFTIGVTDRDLLFTEPCAKVLRRYIQENHLDAPGRSNDPLFVNPQGKKLTRSGVSYVLAKYISFSLFGVSFDRTVMHLEA